MFSNYTTLLKTHYILLLCFLSVVLISIVDYLIAIDISFSICYLVPISLTTRHTSKQIGIFISIFSAFGWYFAEAVKSQLNLTILFWNTIVCLSVFVTWLMDTSG